MYKNVGYENMVNKMYSAVFIINFTLRNFTPSYSSNSCKSFNILFTFSRRKIRLNKVHVMFAFDLKSN